MPRGRKQGTKVRGQTPIGLTLAQKHEMVRWYQEENLTQKQLGLRAKERFHLVSVPNQGTISIIIRDREVLKKRFADSTEWERSKKKTKTSEVDPLNNALGAWVREREAQSGPISDRAMIQKAKDIGEDLAAVGQPLPEWFKYSSDWLARFKQKNAMLRLRHCMAEPVAVEEADDGEQGEWELHRDEVVRVLLPAQPHLDRDHGSHCVVELLSLGALTPLSTLSQCSRAVRHHLIDTITAVSAAMMSMPGMAQGTWTAVQGSQGAGSSRAWVSPFAQVNERPAAGNAEDFAPQPLHFHIYTCTRHHALQALQTPAHPRRCLSLAMRQTLAQRIAKCMHEMHSTPEPVAAIVSSPVGEPLPLPALLSGARLGPFSNPMMDAAKQASKAPLALPMGTSDAPASLPPTPVHMAGLPLAPFSHSMGGGLAAYPSGIPTASSIAGISLVPFSGTIASVSAAPMPPQAWAQPEHTLVHSTQA